MTVPTTTLHPIYEISFEDGRRRLSNAMSDND